MLGSPCTSQGRWRAATAVPLHLITGTIWGDSSSLFSTLIWLLRWPQTYELYRPWPTKPSMKKRQSRVFGDWEIIENKCYLLCKFSWVSFCFLIFGGGGWDKASLWDLGCPGTHSVDQAGLKLRNPPVSASQVLGLKACATTPRADNLSLVPRTHAHDGRKELPLTSCPLTCTRVVAHVPCATNVLGSGGAHL